MPVRMGGFRHVSFYVALALMAGVLSFTGQRVVEAQCLSCGNDLCGCPAPDPQLETCPGPSLYFNDPCGGGYECCWTRFYCHDGSPASWFVSAEFMPMFRDEGGSFLDNRAAAAVDPGIGNFDAELDPGVRLTVGHALGDWYRLEGSWRGSYSWADTIVNVANNVPAPDISFSSNMNDGELNLRRRVRMRRGGAVHGRHRGTGEASFLVGLRYMNISETFTDHLLTQTVETNNDLFGVQIGGLAQILVHDRAWVDVDIKGVAFFNQAGVETNAPALAFDEDRATFMGDLSVTLNYQFAQAWTFRAGYNALWLSGIALATENYIDLANGAADVNHSGNVTYHGPQIGVVWAR